jgi:excisionase family DNA binding protein
VDCEKLAEILMTPATDMPRDMAEALFNIHEMATPEGMDRLQDAAEERGLELGLNGDVDPAGLAGQGERLWKRKELAPVLRVSLRTLDTMVALGEIPCLRLRGRLVRFRLEDVLRKLKGE